MVFTEVPSFYIFIVISPDYDSHLERLEEVLKLEPSKYEAFKDAFKYLRHVNSNGVSTGPEKVEAVNSIGVSTGPEKVEAVSTFGEEPPVCPWTSWLLQPIHL